MRHDEGYELVGGLAEISWVFYITMSRFTGCHD
ncbi:hypothetical protein MJ1HA_1427 [Metallosphaera sedula]|nr:hypothetical protein MJ1HA_1427 [Metallosphaera sedula]